MPTTIMVAVLRRVPGVLGVFITSEWHVFSSTYVLFEIEIWRSHCCASVTPINDDKVVWNVCLQSNSILQPNTVVYDNYRAHSF